MVLKVFYFVSLAQSEKFLQIKPSFRPALVMSIGLQPPEMLCFQVQRVTAQEHVDDKLGNVGALLLVCLLLILWVLDHVLYVAPVSPQ